MKRQLMTQRALTCDDYAILENGNIIAETYRVVDDGVYADAQNNAQLFAAAPALLEACEGLIAYRNRNTLNFQLEKADYFIDLMRAAIAQAKGLVAHESERSESDVPANV